MRAPPGPERSVSIAAAWPKSPGSVFSNVSTRSRAVRGRGNGRRSSGASAGRPSATRVAWLASNQPDMAAFTLLDASEPVNDITVATLGTEAQP